MTDVAQPALAGSFVPASDVPPTGAEQLAALQDALDPTQSPVDLIVAAAPPPPVGRSYAFDFQAGRFVRAANGHAPAGTVGEATLRTWVEKCLGTSRGALPTQPPGYGLLNVHDLVGGPVGAPPTDLEQRIHDALTFHPRIASIADFGFAFDEDEEYLSVGFTIITDRDERVPVVALGVTL